ncbi:cell surface protein [Lactobacillus sp.] [Lactiplantibacillus mudanjiangensis]|nr:cell surface protein [Lactobacillus sp.] [Lactiplantibacillus mudanjiangensis]VDG30791.1 cell surface protein [Lactobacillus sp.] [Lactiplantibacillus mudanjiangensis]
MCLKDKRLIVWLLSMVMFIGGLMLWSQSAQAAMATLGGTYYSTPIPSRVPGTDLGSSVTTNPTVSNIKADGTVSNGGGNRVTSSTTSISFMLKGSIKLSDSKASLKSVGIDVLATVGGDKSAAKKSVLTKAATETSASGASFTFPTSGTTYTASVDLSSIEDDMPLYIAYKFTTGTETNYYCVAILSNTTAMNPQLADASTGDSLTNQTTHILAGDQNDGSYSANGSKAVLTVNDGAKTFTSTFGTTSSYATTVFDLGDTKLIGGSTVKLRESNQFGDYGTYTTTVKKDPAITSDTDKLSVLPDDVSELKDMSDSDVLAWLIKKANVVGKDGDTGSTDGIDIKSATTDLASKLTGLANGDSTTIDLYAVNASGIKSTTLTLTVTKNAGSLSLSGVTGNLDFGSKLEIPTKTTTFAPSGDWGVTVDDTRTVGASWKLMATATPLTTTSGTAHTLAGDLVYRAGDGSADQVLTDKSVEVANGQRQSGSTTTKVTTDWTSSKGILLKVAPSTYAGDYSGEVDWTLQDAP